MVDVGVGHVDLRPQRVLPVGEFPGPHAAKQVQALGRGTIAIGARFARFGERAAVFANLVGVQAADVRVPFLDELLGPLVELLEIIRGVELAVIPTEPEPANVFLDRVDVLDVFLRRVRVVEAQVALAAKFLSDAEIEADRLGVPDVQVAVGLEGLETGSSPGRRHFAGLLVFGHDAADEIELGWG